MVRNPLWKAYNELYMKSKQVWLFFFLSSSVDQQGLMLFQTARRQELRELVESSDAQLEELRQALHDADRKASEADTTLQAAQNELERVRPFEKEVKEKNLLIGKLRHEAVTLNDHLTKALRFLKKGKAEDNVDRYVTMLLPQILWQIYV